MADALTRRHDELWLGVTGKSQLCVTVGARGRRDCYHSMTDNSTTNMAGLFTVKTAKNINHNSTPYNTQYNNENQ